MCIQLTFSRSLSRVLNLINLCFFWRHVSATIIKWSEKKPVQSFDLTFFDRSVLWSLFAYHTFSQNIVELIQEIYIIFIIMIVHYTEVLFSYWNRKLNYGSTNSILFFLFNQCFRNSFHESNIVFDSENLCHTNRGKKSKAISWRTPVYFIFLLCTSVLFTFMPNLMTHISSQALTLLRVAFAITCCAHTYNYLLGSKFSLQI